LSRWITLGLLLLLISRFEGPHGVVDAIIGLACIVLGMHDYWKARVDALTRQAQPATAKEGTND
jgi:hypothetical protein